MRPSAFRTFHPENAKQVRAAAGVDRAIVVPMDSQAAGMSTGTSHLVPLKITGNRIIEALRKLIAIINKDRYHGSEDRIWLRANSDMPD